MNDVVFLNGSFIPRSEAKISADDRGFQFADGVYEVVKYYSGKPFRMEDHLQRLKSSLKEVQIAFDEIDELSEIFNKLLKINQLNFSDAGVYLQISRGINQRVHYFPTDMVPTVYAFSFPFPSFAGNLENGIAVITAEDIRWLRCDIKSVSLLPNTMLFQQAVEKGAGECVLIRNGFVTEATHSSVMGVKIGTIFTHPQSYLVLPGITRKVILEICEKADIPVVEQAIGEPELYTLDELIICGTGSEVTPAISVNGHPVGSGKPGPVTRFLQEQLFALTK